MTKLTKRDMHRKRLEILAEIDRLEEARCDFCSDEAWSNANKSNCDCPSSVEVIKLGNQLMKLVSKRKEAEVKEPVSINYNGLSIETLTVEKYKEMKANGATDTTIMKEIKVGTHRFYKWKREAGLKK